MQATYVMRFVIVFALNIAHFRHYFANVKEKRKKKKNSVVYVKFTVKTLQLQLPLHQISLIHLNEM